MDGTSSTLTFQVGTDGTSNHRISMSLSDMDATALGLKTHDDGPDNIDGNADDAAMDATDLTTQENAQEALARIDVAIKQVSTNRATFGAASNRLSSTITNLIKSP